LINHLLVGEDDEKLDEVILYCRDKETGIAEKLSRLIVDHSSFVIK